MNVLQGLAKRALWFAGSLLAASGVIFLIVQTLPGDIAQATLGLNASPEALEAIRQRWGLDRPAIVRYLDWLAGLARGDLGSSYRSGQPVAQQILPGLAVTGWLVGLALPLAALAAVPLGAVAALWRRRFPGAVASGLSQVGMAVPVFFTGVLLVVVFAVELGWLPANGYTPLTGPDGDPAQWWRHLVLPVAVLVIAQASLLSRYVRSGLVEVMTEDYLRTARAVGWTRWGALRRHGTRNVALSVVTVLGLQAAALLVGAIIVEQVFQLPGLGSALLRAVAQRDLPVVQGIACLLVVAVLTISFLVDALYLVIDPRLRSKARR
ncbi:MAG: ABC transporter permease [Propionibacteriaceae bacterium]|nr:ABC transporter permease [Propionibacteriaceae bacterium]